jgi:hypothetical protein
MAAVSHAAVSDIDDSVTDVISLRNMRRVGMTAVRLLLRDSLQWAFQAGPT